MVLSITCSYMILLCVFLTYIYSEEKNMNNSYDKSTAVFKILYSHLNIKKKPFSSKKADVENKL